MSSISAQGVVERASAELSKRINGLGLRGSKHHHASGGGSGGGGGAGSNSNNPSSTNNPSAPVTPSAVNANVNANANPPTSATGNVASTATSSSSSGGKTSVMERVTNALCGGGSSNSSNNSSNSNLNSNSNSNNSNTPDKPARAGSNAPGGVGAAAPPQSAGQQVPPSIPSSPVAGQTAGSGPLTPAALHGHVHVATAAANYQLQAAGQTQPAHLPAQIASSTLVTSQQIMPPVPADRPPTPSINAIAKQMNLTIGGGGAPPPPSSSSPSPQLFTTMGMAAVQKSQTIGGTPLQLRKQLPLLHHHPYATATAAAAAAVVSQSARVLHPHASPHIASFEQLLQDDRFLGRFFLYFGAYERRSLAQVCLKWRDTLYRSPRFWSGLLPTLQCRELRQSASGDRAKLYNSLIRRGFHALALVGASDEDALDVVHSFPLASKHIHSLSLRCSSISDRGLEALLDHLQSLFELELAGCNEVTEAGLWACLTPRIVSLSLADCINIADEAVGAVAQLLPSLYEFSLQAYHVTDAALGYFSPKQSHSLSILRLQSCWELTNHGIVNIVHSLPHLTVLSLSGCSKLTDDGVELIAENLQKLRALDLSWCPRITDASLEYIACDLNQLEELTLDRCVHITDIGVGYISTMLSLTALFLRWCSQVRDFGLQHLCSMRNLQVLSLAGCPLLTSSGLSSLIQLRHLQELELTNCPGASHELFEYLKEHLPRCLIIE